MSFRLKFTFIVAIIGLLIIGTIVTIRGYAYFGEIDFGPNMIATTAGIAFSTSLTLITILIGIALDRGVRKRALDAPRFLFFRNEAENFKEAYIRYISVLRLSNQLTDCYQQGSWDSFSKNFWPKIPDMNKVQSTLDNLTVDNDLSLNAVNGAYINLFEKFQSIVTISSSGIFEGKENLVQKQIFPSLFTLGAFNSVLNNITRQETNNLNADTSDILYDFTDLNDDIKESVLTCVKVLNALYELSKAVSSPVKK